MNPGDIALVRLLEIGAAAPKVRPALLLAKLPGPYQSLLLCGISTQLHQQVANWDELIQNGDPDFSHSGLHQASTIRLSYLYSVGPGRVLGKIGQIDASRLDRLLTRLADHLRP